MNEDERKISKSHQKAIVDVAKKTGRPPDDLFHLAKEVGKEVDDDIKGMTEEEVVEYALGVTEEMWGPGSREAVKKLLEEGKDCRDIWNEMCEMFPDRAPNEDTPLR